MPPGRNRDAERSGEVDEKHWLDEVGSEVVKRLVAQDARVVDHDRKAAELLQRLLDDALASLSGGHGVVVGNGLASGRPDLLDHLRRWIGVTGEVVDHDPRAATRQLQGVAAAPAAAGPGDYRNVAVESQWRGWGRHLRPS